MSIEPHNEFLGVWGTRDDFQIIFREKSGARIKVAPLDFRTYWKSLVAAGAEIPEQIQKASEDSFVSAFIAAPLKIDNWHYVPSEDNKFFPMNGYLFGDIGQITHKIGPIIGRTSDDFCVVDGEGIYELGEPLQALRHIPGIKQRVLNSFPVVNPPTWAMVMAAPVLER